VTVAGTHRSLGSRVRRWGLATFFASIAVNGALGIYALLAPSFGEIQEKTLATSLFVTGAIVMGLACEPAWERRLLGPVPLTGALLAAFGSSMGIAGMWAEIDSDVYGKALGTVVVAATACTLASLLALVELATRHTWVSTTTLGLLAVGATMVGALPWLGDDAPEAYVRGMGVVLILLAAFTVTLPVLHWVDRAGLAAEHATLTVRYCPQCGRRVTGAVGVALTCSACATRFTVTDVHRAPSLDGATFAAES
jgi:hypothetical protein